GLSSSPDPGIGESGSFSNSIWSSVVKVIHRAGDWEATLRAGALPSSTTDRGSVQQDSLFLRRPGSGFAPWLL
ncbi:MAG: hypothetical protein ACC661_07340, partial [Verrucomicrobiales bacterium]